MKKPSNKIIVEGVDGCGKTTYINKLVKENPEMNYKVVHCTRHTPNTYDYFKDLLESDDNIIFDRFCYGQFVYQSSEDRKEKGWLELKDLVSLETLINSISCEVVYVKSDIDNCLYNCKRDSEDSYYTREYLEDLDSKFRYLFTNLSSVRNFQIYNNEYTIDKGDNKEKTFEKKFDYNSLPKVAAIDFDGTLVYGAEFPNIGKLNTHLVNELYGDNGKYKDYKKILFTHRTGQALIDACNFCADNGIYFDAVNDDIPEVKEALGRTGTPENGRKPWFDIIIDDKSDFNIIGLKATN